MTTSTWRFVDDVHEFVIGGVVALSLSAAGIGFDSASYVNQAISGTMAFTIASEASPRTLAPGEQPFPWDYLAYYQGDAGGTSSYRTMRLINRVYGTADMDQIHCFYAGHMDERDLRGGVTKPTTFVAYTHHFYILNHGDADISNASVAYAHVGVGSHDRDQSGSFGSVAIYTAGDTAWITTPYTSTGIIAGLIGYNVGQIGHATRVTNMSAFRAEDDFALSSAVAYMSRYTAGTGKLAFNDVGGAGSQFVGAVGMGDTVLPSNTVLSLRRIGITLGTTDTTGSTFIANATVTPNADGVSDYRAIRNLITINGANAFANFTGINNVVTDAHTAGTGVAVTGTVSQLTYSGAGPLTTGRAVIANVRLGGDGILTAGTAVFAQVQKTAGTTGTIATSRGLHVSDGGGAHVTSEAIGVDVENFTNTGGSLIAAYRSKLNSGTGRNAFRSEGTALSSHAGGFRIGSNVDPVATLDVTGTIAASSTVTATSYRIGSNQVLGARITGWAGQTATPARTDLGASPTVGALASAFAAFIADAKTHGFLGA